MNFPDLVKDPADVVPYAMDWTARLPSGLKIQSIVAIAINGDCQVVDKTASYPATVLNLQVSGGSAFGWTGDPQIANLSIVTIEVLLSDGQSRLSRSFNVVEQTL